MGEESPFPPKRLILRLQVHRKQLVEGNRASKKTGQMLENSVMHVKLFLRKTGNLRSRLIFALLVLILPHYTI